MKSILSITVLLLSINLVAQKSNYSEKAIALEDSARFLINYYNGSSIIYSGVFQVLHNLPIGTHYLYNENGTIKRLIEYSFSGQYFEGVPDVIQKTFFFNHKQQLDSILIAERCNECEYSPIGIWKFYKDGRLFKTVNADTDKTLTHDPFEYYWELEKYSTIIPNRGFIKVLWRKDIYDSTIKENVSNIAINQSYCDTISTVEKAALAYVATFIGNECYWDGKVSERRDNLTCKLLSALKLGYQCSQQHLGFLHMMFNGDAETLKQLSIENCPLIPETATIQTTFDIISIYRNVDSIQIAFKASGTNLRDNKSWSWLEIDYFHINNNSLRLIKKEKQPL